jgi:uncharacterized protein (DUF2235 family)
MPKNVVVCCDGTNGEFRLRNTNVVRLFELLEQDPARQVAFYDPGLGTMGAPGTWTKLTQEWTKLLGLAFGFGLPDHIGTAYRHLAEYWEPGDRIFLFGFSRGAYTVRALAALLHLFGLIRKGNENLIPYVVRMFGKNHQQVFKLGAEFKSSFSRACPVHFVGVWDTVSSVGLLDPLSLPYTADNPSIVTGRHAVSIDERRCFFRQNLWKPSDPKQDVRQVWFAGVHSDVGGGYAESESGLANISLSWMLQEAGKSGLLLDAARVQKLHSNPQFLADPGATLHQSLTGAWRVVEWLPKRYWERRDDGSYVRRWKLYLGSRRYIAPGSIVHSSVQQRMANAGAKYAPPNLPATFAVDP